MLVELGPQCIVGDSGVPQNRARIPQGRFLASVVAVARLESEQVVVVIFRESLLSTLDRPLDASIVTLDRLRHVHPAEFLHRMVEDTVDERIAPGAGE